MYFLYFLTGMGGERHSVRRFRLWHFWEVQPGSSGDASVVKHLYPKRRHVKDDMTRQTLVSTHMLHVYMHVHWHAHPRLHKYGMPCTHTHTGEGEIEIIRLCCLEQGLPLIPEGHHSKPQRLMGISSPGAIMKKYVLRPETKQGMNRWTQFCALNL